MKQQYVTLHNKSINTEGLEEICIVLHTKSGRTWGPLHSKDPNKENDQVKIVPVNMLQAHQQSASDTSY